MKSTDIMPLEVLLPFMLCIAYIERCDISYFDECMKSVFIEIPSGVFQMDKNIIVGTVYRPPGTDL